MRPQKPHAEIAAANPRRGGVVLVMVLVACVLVLSAQAQVRGGRGTVLQSWMLTASAPIAAAVGALSRSVSNTISSTAALFSAREENERLKKNLDARELELFRLRAEARQGTENLRMLGQGASLPGVVGSVPVLLIEHRAGVHGALIGAGSADGVVPGSPLAVPAGLVGRVVTVGRGVSRAQLLLDTSAAAGARIARTGEVGIVRGDGRGAMILNNIATTSSIARGDLIESAGIDGIYPRGVPIGRVESVARGSKLFLQIRVAPTADFSRLTDVLLLAPSPAVRESAEPTPTPPGSGPMKIGRIALLLGAAVVLEFFVGRSPYRGFLPVDWFLLATAAVARSGDFVRAVATGATAGALEDAVLAQPLIGMNAFAKAIIGYALTLVSVRVVFGGAFAVGAALAAASLANEAIVGLLSALLSQSPIVLVSRDAIWRAAATGVAGGAFESAWNFPWGEWWQRRRLRRLR